VEDQINRVATTIADGSIGHFQRRQERLENATRLFADGMTDGESETTSEERASSEADPDYDPEQAKIQVLEGENAALRNERALTQDTVAWLQSTNADLGNRLEQALEEARRLHGEVGQLNVELDDLHQEVFQLNDASDRPCEPWNGPYDTNVVEADPKEIRYPEDEYNEAREAAERKGEEPPSWEVYWTRRQYISQGLRNSDMHAGRFRETFKFEPAARLHPERADHVQVAWFQCVTHACRYHYKEKFEADHWPVRKVLPDGTTKAITWTFDHGVGYSLSLWNHHKMDDGTMRSWPRRAWPEECRNAGECDHCPSEECLWHMYDKAQGHQVQTEKRKIGFFQPTNGGRAPRTPRRRERRNSDSAWEQESRKWLQQHNSDPTEEEGDAFHDHRQSLGNDSGACDRPEQN